MIVKCVYVFDIAPDIGKEYAGFKYNELKYARSRMMTRSWWDITGRNYYIPIPYNEPKLRIEI
jgi:hypothetical protein